MVNINIQNSKLSVILNDICCKNFTAYAIYSVDNQSKTASFIGEKLLKEFDTFTPFGEGKYFSTTFSFGGITGTLNLEVASENEFLILQSKIYNNTGKDIFLEKLVLLDGIIEINENSLVTPLLNSARSFDLYESDFSKTWTDAVGVYPEKGTGFMLGPIGPGVAYGNINIDKNYLKVSSQMDNILVENGETRYSEKMVILCGKSEQNIPLWAKEVGRVLNARTHRKALDGWSSWYDRTTNITEEHVNKIIKTFNENRDVFNPMLVQIDDGYQVCDGDWSANDTFPSGMKKIAEYIKRSGYMAGKWFAPLMISPELNCLKEIKPALQSNDGDQSVEYMAPNQFHPLGANWLEPTHPIAKKYLKNIIKQAVDDGYDYIKIDFNKIGSQHYNKKLTSLEVLRELYDLYRTAATDGMYMLSCLGNPTRGVIGYCDSARIGPDSHPGGILKSLEHVLRYQYIHKNWWYNDPDASYITPMQEGRYLGSVEGGLDMLKTWHSAIGISCGAAMTSEPLQEETAEKNWRMVEILTPPANETAVLYDLCRIKTIGRFGFTARRSYGDFSTVLLWNDTEVDTTRTIDTETLQLLCDKIAVYSFWDNKFVGVFETSYTTRVLTQKACEHIRITPINSSAQIIGSNFHLSCGAVEILNFLLTDRKLTIVLTDAGARNGSIFIYSENALLNIKTAGLDGEIKKVDEKVYEIKIEKRQRNTDNKIEISF